MEPRLTLQIVLEKPGNPGIYRLVKSNVRFIEIQRRPSSMQKMAIYLWYTMIDTVSWLITSWTSYKQNTEHYLAEYFLQENHL